MTTRWLQQQLARQRLPFTRLSSFGTFWTSIWQKVVFKIWRSKKFKPFLGYGMKVRGVTDTEYFFSTCRRIIAMIWDGTLSQTPYAEQWGSLKYAIYLCNAYSKGAHYLTFSKRKTPGPAKRWRAISHSFQSEKSLLLRGSAEKMVFSIWWCCRTIITY